jgi:hypothetical protein
MDEEKENKDTSKYAKNYNQEYGGIDIQRLIYFVT